jgi:hypothetical protein
VLLHIPPDGSVVHLGVVAPYRRLHEQGESKEPVIPPVPFERKTTMSIYRDAPAEIRRGPGRSGTAEVTEIYPGASTAGLALSSSPRRQWGAEAGMATAEYAIATLAAVSFAGVLVFIMRSDEVRGFLLNLIRTALALP